MINANFLKFIAEINSNKVFKKQVEFIFELYKNEIPDELEKDLIRLFKIPYLFHDFLTIGMTLGNNWPDFFKYKESNYNDALKEHHTKKFVKSIYNVLPNLDVKEFDCQHVDNVYLLTINNKYKMVLIKNKNNNEITLHSIHNKKTKKTNHFNTIFNYEEFKNFLTKSEETFEMNRDLFDMWAL